MRTRSAALLTPLVAFALLAACSAEDEAQDAAALPLSGTAYGMAGLIPPHFPQSNAADWRAFYEALPGLGGWVGTFAAWTQDEGLPAVNRSQIEVGKQYGFRTIPDVGFHRDTHPGLEMLVDFGETAEVEGYAADLAAFAREAKPPFLGVGNEVNRIWEQDPAAFDAWVAALPGIVAQIHSASPTTRVFVTFQYEILRGAGFLTGQQHEPQWSLVDRVAPHVDVVAFTTYPFFDYASPADIPADYYREAAMRAGKPVAFSELGWPAAPLAVAPQSPYGGSPDEQSAFVERLSELFTGVDPVFVLWVWAYDTPAVGSPFESLGLHAQNGTPRPALHVWRSLAGVAP